MPCYTRTYQNIGEHPSWVIAGRASRALEAALLQHLEPPAASLNQGTCLIRLKLETPTRISIYAFDF